jgi:hypothetical protein
MTNGGWHERESPRCVQTVGLSVFGVACRLTLGNDHRALWPQRPRALNLFDQFSLLLEPGERLGLALRPVLRLAHGNMRLHALLTFRLRLQVLVR